jgi:S-DNA-T family DNA segregation ATPase FtsK/SpoIIIE
MRLGPEEVLLFQAAQCTGAPAQLPDVVDAIRHAASSEGITVASTPWPAPLPDVVPIDAEALLHGVVGIVDDPDEQRTAPLRWSLADGHLGLIGSPGMGLTSALGLLAATATRLDPSCHLYVIDGRGSPALDALATWDACAGVIRLHERERIVRAVKFLSAELTERSGSSGGRARPILLLIDGFDAVRRALDDIDTGGLTGVLEQIIANGSAHRIVVVATFDRAGSVPPSFASRCADRWVFHLADPLDAIGAGVTASALPEQRPGRVVVSSSGLQAQLMFGDCTPGPGGVDESPVPIECLPAVVEARSLPMARAGTSGVRLPIGLSFDDGKPCSLDVPDGEHVLVLGPTRSGRTTAIDLIVQAWREVHSSGWCAVVAPRRRTRTLAEMLEDIPRSGPVLVAVDDAELVEDDGGRLERLIGQHRPHCLVIAAGKPASLRHSYGHWTGTIRRSRLGIVLSGCSDVDADLLGFQLPRQSLIAPRPGLGWLVDAGVGAFAQLARPEPVLSEIPGGSGGWKRSA